MFYLGNSVYRPTRIFFIDKTILRTEFVSKHFLHLHTCHIWLSGFIATSKSVDVLPFPKGALSTAISPTAIKASNNELTKLSTSPSSCRFE